MRTIAEARKNSLFDNLWVPDWLRVPGRADVWFAALRT